MSWEEVELGLHCYIRLLSRGALRTVLPSSFANLTLIVENSSSGKGETSPLVKT